MAEPVLGTANLFGATDATVSLRVLAEAARLGYCRFDTAPSYGHGVSEQAVGDLARTLDAGAVLTTKVGLEAAPPPRPGVRFAKAAARRLPVTIQDRLRGGAPEIRGRFAVDDVRRSVERSRTRLPRVDRLLLHEPHPADITAELIDCLQDYRERGEVGSVGIAGANGFAAESVARAPEMFDVVHLSVGLGSELPDLPGHLLRVGHGALGPGAADLRAVQERLETDPGWARRWRAALGESGQGSDADVVDVLIGRAVALGVDEIVVATSRPERLEALQRAVRSPVPAGSDLLSLLAEVRR